MFKSTTGKHGKCYKHFFLFADGSTWWFRTQTVVVQFKRVGCFSVLVVPSVVDLPPQDMAGVAFCGCILAVWGCDPRSSGVTLYLCLPAKPAGNTTSCILQTYCKTETFHCRIFSTNSPSLLDNIIYSLRNILT